MKLMLSQLFLVVVENNEPRKVVQEEKTCDSKGNKWNVGKENQGNKDDQSEDGAKDVIAAACLGQEVDDNIIEPRYCTWAADLGELNILDPVAIIMILLQSKVIPGYRIAVFSCNNPDCPDLNSLALHYSLNIDIRGWMHAWPIRLILFWLHQLHSKLDS